MLLEFKTKNYRSFKDTATFSMQPAPKQTGLDYSVQTEQIVQKEGKLKEMKGLCSAVIYGPNAAGKTNLIGAMDTMRAIVLRGNIQNASEHSSPNEAAYSLELIPNNWCEKACTEFSIRFTESNLLIEYTLKLDLGNFLEADYPRRIVEERLSVNDKLIFARGKTLEVFLLAPIKKYVNKSIKRKTAKTMDIARSSLSDTELFLNNGFKTIFAKDLVALILKWFDEKFMVIYRADAIKVMRKFVNPKENTVYIERTLTDAAKAFGVRSNALGYRQAADSDDVSLCSIFEDKKIAIQADAYESYGTTRFINEFPLVINAILNGGTLVMDEFDASIHPMALMNIINIFHNDEINIHHAQLIFNTHNPIFLDASLFRRDEIKFVERDEKTNQSVQYSLSDFRTADGIRKGEDYMSNYFVNRYGAITDVDFAPILEEIVSANSEVNSHD